ncbi:MAG: hypothetical protein ACO1OO_02520 [Flavisolibacter sp.]
MTKKNVCPRRGRLHSIVLTALLCFFSLLASAHTIELRAKLNADGSVTFYARTYHGGYELLSGGFIVDGTTYPFTSYINAGQLPVGTVQISTCSYQFSANDNYQVVTVSGLNTCVPHTFNCTSNTPETPYCPLANTMNLGQAAITSQPAFANGVACIGRQGNLTVEASGPHLTYQWQKWDSEAGYVNMTDDAVYSGTQSATLVIAEVTAAMASDKFRSVVTATDDCSNSSSVTSNEVTLVAQEQPIILTNPEDLIICKNNQADFSATASGGTLAYQWQESLNGTDWTNISSATQNTLSFTPALSQNGNQYRVQVSNSCVVYSDPATLTVNALTITAVPTTTNLVCSAETTQLTVTPQNGTGDITYTLQKNDGSSASKTVTSPSPAVFTVSGGIYTITATIGTCAVTATATITQLPRISANLQAIDATCYGASNGAISLANVSGGTAPYSYSLGGLSYVESNEINYRFENVAPGVYNSYIKDANGCVQPIGTSTILQPAAIVATIAQEALVPCSNSQTKITVSATGGKGNYQYQLDGGDVQSTTAFVASVGTHSLTIIDGSGCSTTTSINVTTQSSLTYAPLQIVNNSCIGGNTGTASVMVNGAAASVTYALEGSTGYSNSQVSASGTAATFNGLPAGVYTITANDGAGCAGITSFEVTEPQTAVGTSNGAPDLNLTLVAPQQYTMDATTGNTVTLTYDVSSTSLTNVAARGVIVRVSKLFSSWTLDLADANGNWEKLPENGMPWTEFKLKSGVAINCGSSLLLNIVMQRHGVQTAKAAPLTASARFADNNQDLKEGNNFSAVEWSVQ